jgi:stress response protein YsnF
MLVFKENVYGFVYDSQYGNVTQIFKTPLDEETINIIKESIDEDYDVLFTDIEDVKEMINITSKEDLEDDEEGFNDVLDFI